MHWDRLSENKVKCRLCPRECEVADVERGACGVRENQGGKYQTLVYGALCSANVDPIEKKPLFHYLPGTQAFSVATAGCNIECKFCQNWQISQFRPEQVESVLVPPVKLVDACRTHACPTGKARRLLRPHHQLAHGRLCAPPDAAGPESHDRQGPALP